METVALENNELSGLLKGDTEINEEETLDDEGPPQVEVVFLGNNENPFDDKIIEFYLQQHASTDNDTETNESPNEEEEEVAEIIELDKEEDPDDEDVIAFYIQQSINKSRRTCPATEATNIRQNTSTFFQCKSCKFQAKSTAMLAAHEKTKHKMKCDKCGFAAETRTQLNCHNVAHHPEKNKEGNKRQEREGHGNTRLKCKKCDFTAHSSIQLKKHMKAAHEEVCWFWTRGGCDKIRCRFEHPESGQVSQPCRFQESCRRPNCPYQHNMRENQKKSCRYGASCWKENCSFAHSFLDQQQTMGFW